MFYFRLLFILSLALWPSLAGADIYRYVDPDGVVHFSNTQPDGKYQLYLREAPKAPPALPLAGSSPGDDWMANYAERYARAHNLSPALVRAIIEGGVKYIKELLATFDGNLANTIAAYNAGPAAVKKYGGIPPYQETRQYVRRVMDLYRQYSAVE
jgi:hypothetical protein